MHLDQLLKNINNIKINLKNNPEVVSLTCNSNKVAKNWVFACLKGVNFDGHNFAKNAIEKGACAIIVEKNLNLPNQVLVKNSHLAFANMCANFFNNPAKQLKLIGVTGTNGKTSVTKTIKNLLTLQEKKVGLIGTIQCEINDQILETENTTPNHFEFQKILKQMTNENCEFAIMEVSSHALAQNRTGESTFEIGIFTNLSQDHLDYHGTMENYYNAKKKLFTFCKIALISIDCPFGFKLANELKSKHKKVITFSTNSESNANFIAKNIKLSANNVNYNLYDKKFNKTTPIKFSTPGLFSVQNSMAAVICCQLLGFEIAKIADSIKLCSPIKGRSETIKIDQNFSVICDYAHTPDGLLNILKSIKTYCTGKTIIMFGCGGDRDTKKRALMGEIAAKNSDFVVITSDNPRTENPQSIIEQISKGVEKFKTPFVKIVNRKKAIEFSLKIAKKNDVVLLAGKGHEPYQIVGTKKLQFNEPQIVKQIAEKLNKPKQENLF